MVTITPSATEAIKPKAPLSTCPSVVTTLITCHRTFHLVAHQSTVHPPPLRPYLYLHRVKPIKVLRANLLILKTAAQLPAFTRSQPVLLK